MPSAAGPDRPGAGGGPGAGGAGPGGAGGLVGREAEGAEDSPGSVPEWTAREESSRVQEKLTATREELDRVEAREREVARRTAQLRGDGDAAEAQALELDRRAAHLEEEVATSSEELRDLDTQGDLFGDRVETLAATVEAAREAVVAAREAVVLRRDQVEEARKREMAAQDRASSLRGRLAALQRLEEDREGVDPVIRALLDAGWRGFWASWRTSSPPSPRRRRRSRPSWGSRPGGWWSATGRWPVGSTPGSGRMGEGGRAHPPSPGRRPGGGFRTGCGSREGGDRRCLRRRRRPRAIPEAPGEFSSWTGSRPRAGAPLGPGPPGGSMADGRGRRPGPGDR
jgi:hypothetical protein